MTIRVSAGSASADAPLLGYGDESWQKGEGRCYGEPAIAEYR
jgi:hypothetical protein